MNVLKFIRINESIFMYLFVTIHHKNSWFFSLEASFYLITKNSLISWPPIPKSANFCEKYSESPYINLIKIHPIPICI
jgi:hypothetical protein